MNFYRVDGGVARVGPGQQLGLSKEQAELRAHNVDVIETAGKVVVVKSKTALEFKVGEIIGLPDLPKNLVTILVPVGAPQTEIEKIAAGHARDRQVAAAKQKTKAKAGAKGKK